MNILDKIVLTKREETERQKRIFPIEKLTTAPYYNRSCNSLKEALRKTGASGIIAEFKQKSPSKGAINPGARVEVVTQGYVEAGASGLSVLTDAEYFGGSLDNLVKAREVNPVTPLLRKDFIIDIYQVEEAKANGADVILLIAACLEKEEIETLAARAKKLGMEILLEIHDESELLKVTPLVDLVGVNNRNLKTFTVDIETSVRLAGQIPGSFVKVTESGLSSAQDIRQLRSSGYQGFLIGETFMKTADPGKACRELITGIHDLTDLK